MEIDLSGELITQVFCAWCGKLIKEKKPLYNKASTHTICDECSSKELSKRKKSKEQKGKDKDKNTK